jgi:hypothetical protein
MDQDESRAADGQREDAPDELVEERDRGSGGGSDADLGLGDYGALLGNPVGLYGDPKLDGRVALRCPEASCEQTGTAADYRKAYWPKCRHHRVRMVLLEAG